MVQTGNQSRDNCQGQVIAPEVPAQAEHRESALELCVCARHDNVITPSAPRQLSHARQKMDRDRDFSDPVVHSVCTPAVATAAGCGRLDCCGITHAVHSGIQQPRRPGPFRSCANLHGVIARVLAKCAHGIQPH